MKAVNFPAEVFFRSLSPSVAALRCHFSALVCWLCFESVDSMNVCQGAIPFSLLFLSISPSPSTPIPHSVLFIFIAFFRIVFEKLCAWSCGSLSFAGVVRCWPKLWQNESADMEATTTKTGASVCVRVGNFSIYCLQHQALISINISIQHQLSSSSCVAANTK